MKDTIKLLDIDQVKPVDEILGEFFYGRESTAYMLFQMWDMFYLALSSEELDGADRIERANLANNFYRLCVLVARLDKHRK